MYHLIYISTYISCGRKLFASCDVVCMCVSVFYGVSWDVCSWLKCVMCTTYYIHTYILYINVCFIYSMYMYVGWGGCYVG